MAHIQLYCFISMQDIILFQSKRSHSVSRQNPHVAVTRPTLDSDEPTFQSQPAEAVIFVAENEGYVQLVTMSCLCDRYT